ncbi:hypothetical protein BJ878DRAFT_497157 [Calycina marina]|uniref:Uncharacterized protein n=1 Tax=Calycina marina TaxID=1763456 RepID=A0A9P8CH09_9HELO|nr:hypothetical protein BJ878DRAFT_497157 [Calycina marina]
MILADLKVAKWYHEEYKGKGRVIFTNTRNYFEAANSYSEANIQVVQRNYAFVLEWFDGPVSDMAILAISTYC